MIPPLTYFAIGSTLANMQNIELNLLTTDTIQIANGARIAYVGSVNTRAGDGRLTRDGAKSGKWLLSLQAQTEFFAFLATEYGDYATSTDRFFITTVSEDGFYSPYYAYVERPATVDSTITVPVSGGWFTAVALNLVDAQLQQVSKSANYTRTTTDRLIPYDTTSGNVADTLFTAASATTYTVYGAIKTAAAHNLVITPHSGETINGASTLTLTTLNSRADFYTDGVNWFTL